MKIGENNATLVNKESVVTDMQNTYVAQARWRFRGTWQYLEREVIARDMSEAGRVLYSVLPITFFRSQDHAVMIRYPLKQRLELATAAQEAENWALPTVAEALDTSASLLHRRAAVDLPASQPGWNPADSPSRK